MTSGSANHDRILAAATEWAGARMALATVIETWRSAPCPVGTHMLIHADGRFVGSVSGGCIEGDVLHCAERILLGDAAMLRRYGVADGAAWEVGLPCGGDIQVLVQPVSDAGFSPELFAEIIAARGGGETVYVGTNLESGKSGMAAADCTEGFVNIYPPPRRLLIVGAVEIASALAAIAMSQGISVTICDPRSRFLTRERFPTVNLDDRWPDEAVAAFAPDTRSAVVTLSHDPKIDDPALIAALDTPALYVAALGSKASQAARLARLSAAGLSTDQLARIEGPAGVSINAISAPEIALSIAGGMIRVFNKGLR